MHPPAARARHRADRQPGLEDAAPGYAPALSFVPLTPLSFAHLKSSRH
jgi:hypothetical protein